MRAISGSAKVRYKYTGQEDDAETGLYYYNARYYDPELGRFISADSIVQDPGNPQTLNRFSYCGNNPLIYTDPSGHAFLGDFGKFVSKAVHAVGKFFGDVAHFVGKNWRVFVSIAITAAAFYAAGGIIAALGESEVLQACIEVSSLTQAGIHAAAGAIAGGLTSAINHGNIGLGMITGGLSAGVANYAGSFIGNLNWGYQFTGRTAVGGVAGGFTSAIYGGNFWKGFLSGSETAAAAYIFNHILHAGGRLFYHRHGNNEPNWGIPGETGPVTLELSAEESGRAMLRDVMRTYASAYFEVLSFAAGAIGATLRTVEFGATVYEFLSNTFKVIMGEPATIPKFPLDEIINPPSLN